MVKRVGFAIASMSPTAFSMFNMISRGATFIVFG
jgi:hypothetical protein